MAHYFDVERDFRPTSAGRNDPYRFGRANARHGRGRAALNRINGCLKMLIAGIADAKMRRLRRELAWRGIHFDPVNKKWVADPRRSRSGGG